MTTYTTDTLTGPARALATDARNQAHRPIHHATIATWLLTLHLDSIDAVGGDNTAATALLLTEHKKGIPLATTVLLGAKARMLSAISRTAPGETRDERFQATIDAYLTRALARCKPDHQHLDAQLYWATLRTVHTNGRRAIQDASSQTLFGDITELSGRQRANGVAELEAAADLVVDFDSQLTASIVLDWAQSRGLLTARDREAIDLRFGGDSVLPVREVAHRLNISEDGLETRLRRALRRLRDGVHTDNSGLRQACINALWPDDAAPRTTDSRPSKSHESALVA